MAPVGVAYLQGEVDVEFEVESDAMIEGDDGDAILVRTLTNAAANLAHQLGQR